jgi:hypothetical protein
MDATTTTRSLWSRLYALFESAFELMARYPYDMAEQHWHSELYDRPDDDGDTGPGSPSFRPMDPPSGRSIKIVPPPSSQQYRHARPTRMPARHLRRRQPV